MQNIEVDLYTETLKLALFWLQNGGRLIHRFDLYTGKYSKIDGQEIETVDLFTNLGSIHVVDVNGGTNANLKPRINIARHAFAILKPIWKSRKITPRTEIRLFNTNVWQVITIIWFCQCWKMTYELAIMAKNDLSVYSQVSPNTPTDKVVRQSFKLNAETRRRYF